jgi:hypothetical protein
MATCGIHADQPGLRRVGKGAWHEADETGKLSRRAHAVRPLLPRRLKPAGPSLGISRRQVVARPVRMGTLRFAHPTHIASTLFTELAGEVTDIATPIGRQQPILDVAMERAVWPIADPCDMAVFDRIVVDVVDVPLKIGVVPDRMLPITALPDSSFTPRRLARRAPRSLVETTRKARLDQAPARWVVGVVGRQRPDGVEVVGQDADSDRFKWKPLLHGFMNSSQPIDFSHEKIAGAVPQRHGEEEHPAVDFHTSVSRHCAMRIALTVLRGARSAWARFALPTLRIGVR